MELQTISAVSKSFRVSTRTLRYYEKLGLIKSTAKENYAYRTYDEDNIVRLQQIILLKKLRIPLKQIAVILESDQSYEMIDTFYRSLKEINAEISALSTIRTVLNAFIERLRENAHVDFKLQLMDDQGLLDMVNAITASNINFREKTALEEIEAANKELSKLKDVRIVYLPPAVVAAYRSAGDEPERRCSEVIDAFVIDNNLIRIKPDLRRYGFSINSSSSTGDIHGYEMWVTVPGDINIPAPLERKQFEGGLYAAHMIEMGNFHEWEWLRIWVENSKQYTYRGNWDAANMFGFLEEGLGYVYNVKKGNSEPESLQLDLLFPIKEIEEEAEMDTLTIKPIGELVSGVDEIELFDMPELMLIGKEIRGGGVLGDHTPVDLWERCIADGTLDVLKNLPRVVSRALMGWSGNYTPEDKTYSYIVGVLAPLGTPVPEGMTFRVLPATLAAKGVYGKGYHMLEQVKKMGYDNNYGLCGWNIELNFEDDPDPLPKPIDQWSVLSPVKKVR